MRLVKIQKACKGKLLLMTREIDKLTHEERTELMGIVDTIENPENDLYIVRLKNGRPEGGLATFPTSSILRLIKQGRAIVDCQLGDDKRKVRATITLKEARS